MPPGSGYAWLLMRMRQFMPILAGSKHSFGGIKPFLIFRCLVLRRNENKRAGRLESKTQNVGIS
jgi:hypothetical protein